MSYACGFLLTVFDEYPCSRLGSSTTSRVMSLSSRSLRRVAQAGQVPSGFLKKIALYTWWIKAQKRSNHRDFCISGAKPIHHDWNMSIVSWEMNSDRREGPDRFKKKKESNLFSWLPAKRWRDRKFTNDVDFYGHRDPCQVCFDHIFPHSKEKRPSSSASSIKEISATCKSYGLVSRRRSSSTLRYMCWVIDQRYTNYGCWWLDDKSMIRSETSQR